MTAQTLPRQRTQQAFCPYCTDRAHVMWADAVTLLEQRCTCTRIVLPAHAQVLPVAGVDHCPVPDQAATVCGLALPAVPAPSDLRPPTGTPCHICFGPVR